MEHNKNGNQSNLGDRISGLRDWGQALSYVHDHRHHFGSFRDLAGNYGLGGFVQIWRVIVNTIWKLRVSVLAAFICSTAALAAIAETPEYGEGSFVQKLGRQVTVSVQQEFDGFLDELARLDAESKVVSTGEYWTPFWEADVSVYFLEDMASIKNLGNLEQQIKKASGRSTEKSFVTRVDVTLESGRSVLVKFVNVSAVSTQNYSEIGCRAAASLYLDLAGRTEGGGSANAFEECH